MEMNPHPPPPFIIKAQPLACHNIPGKPSGKMTQAALALSGTVVLARSHSKLESIFSSVAGHRQGLRQGGRIGISRGGG